MITNRQNIVIGINALGAHFGGIVRVLEEVANELSEGYVVRVWHSPQAVRFSPSVNVVSKQKESRRASFMSAIVAGVKKREHVDLRIDIAQGFLPGVRSSRRILIVHDLGFLNPATPHVSRLQRLYRRLVTRWGILQSDAIVCVSESTRQEVIRFAPTSASKLIVAALPVDNIHRHLRGRGRQRSPHGLSTVRPLTLLAFGHAQNKGVETLLQYLSAHTDARLRVICPDAMWHAMGYGDLARELRVENRVCVLNGLADSQLVEEYQNADVFCMPSSYEGYGLPVAEALACGCPTVISDLDVLEATGRGFAVRSSGWGLHAIERAIEQALALPTDHWRGAAKTFELWTWRQWTESVLSRVLDSPSADE